MYSIELASGGTKMSEDLEKLDEKSNDMLKEESLGSISTISIDMSNAKAFNKQFLAVDEMVTFIIENVPPNKREEPFTFTPILLQNLPELKSRLDPSDPSKGDWNNFKEIDITQWILRGTLNMTNPMYPICNRGKQYFGMCLLGLAYGKLYDLDKFTEGTVDDILKYGDRMHTLLMKSRIECAKKLNLDLSDPEICHLLNLRKITINDFMKSFLVGNFQVTMDTFPKTVEGDITADNQDEIKNIEEGFKLFFANHQYGIFNSKDICVSVFNLDGHYYMFDPANRGPSGKAEENGTACITRHTELTNVVKILEENLPKEGPNNYYIDALSFEIEYANRNQPEIEKVISINPKVTAFDEVDPGKLILSASLNQNNPKFEKTPNATTNCNALVALAMTQIHKPQTWTRPIVDDVLTNGNLLFDLSKENLGYNFNSWEDTMTLDLVNRCFKIGVWQVKVELRDDVQCGILNMKHPTILNLRRGLEHFFESHTHGVIQCECQTCATWIDNDLYYLFDPYSRNKFTGLFQIGGTACVMVCKTVKMLSKHFLENVTCCDCEFQITPVEISIQETKEKKKKKKKLKCELLKCKDIAIFCEEDKKSCGSEPSTHKKPQQVEDTEQTTDECLPKSKIQMKKELVRQLRSQQTNKESEKLLRQLRQEYTPLCNGICILRAHYSQNNHRYTKASRNNQAIPNAVVAIVMSKLHEPATWSYKNIEIILDSADVLYKDSWWFYRPYNPILGLKNVLRTFHVEHATFSTSIYKAAIRGDLEFRPLYVGLLNFFLDETAGIVITKIYKVAVFQKAGFYYLFDPYDRDREGKCVKCGCACVLRFECLELMAKKLLENAMCYACPCQCGRLGDKCLLDEPEDQEPTNDLRYAIHAVSICNQTIATPVCSCKGSVSSCRTENIV